MIVCANCGRENPASARFCPECGDYLGWQSATAPSTQPVAEPELEPQTEPEVAASPAASPDPKPPATESESVLSEVASALAEGCPVIATGGAVEVYETVAM